MSIVSEKESRFNWLHLNNIRKRTVKKAVIPGYGKKGSGWIKDPKKAAYNKVYKKTTFSFWDLFK